MDKLTFNLQLFAEEEGQTETSSADFATMSASEQSKILGKMVRGETTEPDKEVEEEEKIEEVVEKEKTVAKRKIKVNGEDIELTDEELIAHAQKGMSADKKFEEASKLRKEAKAERDALEAEKLVKQTESNKGRLAQSAQDVKNFATEFEKAFGEEFNQYDINHIDIFTQFKMQQMITNQNAQQTQSILDGAYNWAEKNPAELEKLDDDIYALANEPTARKQFTALLKARGNFDDGKATVKDLQLLEEFRLKATTTKPIPKEAVEEQKKVRAEKAGSVTVEKNDDAIDWERFKTDNDYQAQMLGRRATRK